MEQNQAFHHDNPAVFAAYQSSEQGLTPTEASARRQQYGENRLPLSPPKPAWLRFLLQFHNVLIYVLLASGVVSLLLDHWVDSGVIFAVVVVNAIVGFIQEGKAEDALRAIMSMTKTQCMVVREGSLRQIDSTQLVPGDVVMLQAGDRVPADVRLFYCKDLRCDESALTGEAQPVGKNVAALDASTPLAERKNMAYMGTMVTYGLARGLVTETALQTEIGKISDMVGKVEMPETPLQIQLAQFARQLTLGILIFAGLTMLFGVLLHDYELGVMFQAAIGIAVAAIPEGLPAIVTIALAIGVQRMAKKNALVRRLPAVEVLGSVDVICSDKTGTLTANAMTVREVFSAKRKYRVFGEGYHPEGAIEIADSGQKVLIDHDSSFTQACLIALLCNDASISREGCEWVLHGDPTEGALLVLAMKHGLVYRQQANEWPRVDLVPFDSERRYMATLHHNQQGEVCLMVKGAPDRLVSFAKWQLGKNGLEPLQQEIWLKAMEDFARHGLRVMALAVKELDSLPSILDHAQVEQGLTLVALAGISDPPRAEAIESVALCHQAGIQVKMITGDNPITAAVIGAELGLQVERIVTGSEIDQMTDEELAKAASETEVFARTSPGNKLQLVTALQNSGHVVSMTGDGVNDSPALKKASIGVAMGLKGTDAAKEAADFVLTDDNFATISRAVKEGRTVYDNILKSITFILPTNLAEALVIVTAIVLGRMMPITPAQILWVNMITAVTLALALAFEPSERHIMKRPPRPSRQGLFSVALLGRTLLVGTLGAFIVFGLFADYRESGASIEQARTIAVNSLVMIEVVYLFNCRFLTESIFHRQFFKGIRPALIASVTVISMQLLFTYLPASQATFGLQSINLNDWLWIVACSLPVLLLVELEKALLRWFKSC